MNPPGSRNPTTVVEERGHTHDAGEASGTAHRSAPLELRTAAGFYGLRCARVRLALAHVPRETSPISTSCWGQSSSPGFVLRARDLCYHMVCLPFSPALLTSEKWDISVTGKERRSSLLHPGPRVRNDEWGDPEKRVFI